MSMGMTHSHSHSKKGKKKGHSMGKSKSKEGDNLSAYKSALANPANTAGVAVGGAVLVAGVAAVAYRRGRANAGYTEMVNEETPLVETPMV
jgi:hypothetical protein